MNHDLTSILWLLLLFLLTIYFGLIVTPNYWLINESNDYPSMSVGVIVVSIIVLLLIRFKLSFIIKLWFAIALFTGLFLSLEPLTGYLFALFFSLSLIVLRMVFRDLIIHNLTELLLYGGIIALINPFFDVTSALFFLLIISVYDIISVFLTKHMVTLARAQQELNTLNGLIINDSNGYALLGGGDIAFSMLFISVMARDVGFLQAIISSYFISASLFLLMISSRKGKFYPAMPFIFLPSLLSFIVFKLI